MQQLMVFIHGLFFSFLIGGRTCRYSADAGFRREAKVLASDDCQPDNAETAIECRGRL